MSYDPFTNGLTAGQIPYASNTARDTTSNSDVGGEEGYAPATSRMISRIGPPTLPSPLHTRVASTTSEIDTHTLQRPHDNSPPARSTATGAAITSAAVVTAAAAVASAAAVAANSISRYGKKKVLRWTPGSTAYAMECFAACVRDGTLSPKPNAAQKNKEAWKIVAAKITRKYSLPVTEVEMNTKYNNEKARYKLWEKLRKLPGVRMTSEGVLELSADQWADFSSKNKPPKSNIDWLIKTGIGNHDTYSTIFKDSLQRADPSCIMRVRPYNSHFDTQPSTQIVSQSTDYTASDYGADSSDNDDEDDDIIQVSAAPAARTETTPGRHIPASAPSAPGRLGIAANPTPTPKRGRAAETDPDRNTSRYKRNKRGDAFAELSTQIEELSTQVDKLYTQINGLARSVSIVPGHADVVKAIKDFVGGIGRTLTAVQQKRCIQQIRGASGADSMAITWLNLPDSIKQAFVDEWLE